MCAGRGVRRGGTWLAAVCVALPVAAGCRTPLRRSTGATPAAAHVARAWPEMGTMFVATAWARIADTAAVLDALRAARDSVRLVDSLMSVFRPASELSRVNAAAGGPAVAVSAQTMRVLLLAREYWRLSGGAFDPTVGPLVAAWGFHGEQGRVPPAAEVDSLRGLVGYGAVELDSIRHTVRLPRPGMQLDLGGIAKGYALDLARAALRGAPVRGGMLDLGGNVLVFGQPPASEGQRWRIGVAHPRRDGRLLGVVELDSGAVATSGDYEHFYVIGGVRYAHLIDPRSGRPARGVMSATVVGPRGERSDGLSAALYLAGLARGLALADSLPGVAAIYVVDCGGDDVRRGDVVLSARAREWFQLDAAVR